MNGVIYARYSSDSQREESIEGQIRECKEFAGRNCINIVDIYIDRAFSAKTDKKPDFQRMIKESSRKDLDVEELEQQKGELSVRIMKEEMSKPVLTREQILFWFHRLRKLKMMI